MAGAGGGTGGRDGPRAAAPGAMGRGIDLTPQGLRTPGALQDYTVLRAQPWAPPLLARATHVRFWVDWPFVQPDPRHALGDPANPGLPHLLALDAQVGAAIADGLQPILMPYRYPRWVNHTRAPRDGKSPEWRLPDSGHGSVQPVGRVRRGAVGSLRGADGVLRGRQRAEPPALAAARDRRARRLDDPDGRRRRPPARLRGALPGAVDLRRRVRPARGDHGAAPASSPRCSTRSTGAASPAATTGSGRSTTTTTPSSAATARPRCGRSSPAAGAGARRPTAARSCSRRRAACG